MSDLRFDITPGANPLGTILVSLTKSDYELGTTFRQELNGTGAGKIVINGSHASVTAANFARGNYVRVYDLALSAYIGGFFLTEGSFVAISSQETAGETLTFGGPGSLAYLGRAEWWKTAFSGTVATAVQKTKQLAVSRDALISFRSDLGYNLGAGIDKHLPVGRGPGSVYYVRSLLGFALDFSDVAEIVSAKLFMYRSNVHGAIASPNFYIKRATSAWTEGIKGSQLTPGGVELWWAVNAVHWGNQPTTVSTAHVNATSAAAGWNNYDITALVKAWAPTSIPGGGGLADHGLMLKQTAADSSTADETGTMYAEFQSRENSFDPYIELIYKTTIITSDGPGDDGLWHFLNTPLGAILKRAIDEAQAGARPSQPIPALTYDFTAALDSQGQDWAASVGDNTAAVGANYLDKVADFMRSGLTIIAKPDLSLRAYQNAFGSDKSGTAYGTGVVRFKHGVNIASEATQEVHDSARVSHLLVKGQSSDSAFTVLVTDPGAPIPKEGLLEYGQTNDPTALAAAGQDDIRKRAAAIATASLTHVPGFDEATGLYTPGWPGGAGHYWLGDIVTLHTESPTDGLRAYDFNEQDLRVAAINWILRAGGDWDINLELGATYYSISQPGFQIAGGVIGVHSHPPNPRICRGTVGGNVLLGLLDAVLKASSTYAPTPKQDACNGNDAAASHWSAVLANGVLEEYWAADLGSTKEVVRSRVKQGYSTVATTPPQPEGATEMKLYGSNSPTAWSWLPSGKIVADPAANGWTLVNTFAGVNTGSDTGIIGLPASAFRYWMLRASAGPAAGTGEGWNIQEIELYATTCTIVDVGDFCSHGTLLEAAACDHKHRHPNLAGVGPYHAAAGVTYDPAASGLAATTAQAAIDELTPRAWKQPVRAATTVAGALATSFANGQTIDGVVLATGDRILLKDQAAGAENGLYVVAATGAPVRAIDMNVSAEVLGAATLVSEGTANADKVLICTTNAPITLGTTALVFAALSGGVTDADYLVGTAQAGLSAEIVVGATPGGELGGTWASPTVDATHSGSAHHDHPAGNSAKASATADLTATTVTAADVTGATLSLVAGTYIAVGNFDVSRNGATNDRLFEGILDVAGTDENDLAVWTPLGSVVVRDQVLQVWRLVLASTTTVKLQARHSGGTAGDFTVNAANTTLTAYIAGASGPRVVRSAGSVSVVTTFADTDMTFAVEANKNYHFRFVVFFNTNAVTVGIRLAVNGPAAPTSVKAGGFVATGGGGGNDSTIGQGSATAYDTVIVTTTSGPGLTNAVAIIEGILRNGANAGNLVLRHASETATTTSIEADSFGTLTPY